MLAWLRRTVTDYEAFIVAARWACLLRYLVWHTHKTTPLPLLQSIRSYASLYLIWCTTPQSWEGWEKPGQRDQKWAGTGFPGEPTNTRSASVWRLDAFLFRKRWGRIKKGNKGLQRRTGRGRRLRRRRGARRRRRRGSEEQSRTGEELCSLFFLTGCFFLTGPTL